MNALNADTGKINEVAGQLNALADRLHKVMTTHEVALSPQAAGSDEVSVRAAATMNEVHKSFRSATDSGVTELREISHAVGTVSTKINEADTTAGFNIKSDKPSPDDGVTA